MKKFAFLLLVSVTYYLAGMYRYPPLLVLGGMELLLLPVLFFLSRYFKKHINATFLKRSDSIERGMELSCYIHINHTGRIPVSQLAIRLRMGYQTEKRHTVKKLYGACHQGGQDMEFLLSAPYCGLLQLRMERLRLYDYLALFSAKKALEETMQVAVFPDGCALRLEVASFDWNENSPSAELTVGQAGEAFHEIKQLREYRTGDSNRHIHWNQSARMDGLWIKEYEKETDSMAYVLLDTAGLERAGTGERSRFYTLLSALVLGLLRSAASVRVYWQDASMEAIVDAEVNDIRGCREVLFRLYQTDFGGTADVPFAGFLEQGMPPVQNVFRLNAGLGWYLGETLLYQFSSEGLEREIAEKVFVI